MRVMVASENRFLRTQSGQIYSTTVCDYGFWRRYLTVFDEVVVFARVGDVGQYELEKQPANGPNLTFIALPYYIGPWQYLRRHFRVAAIAKRAVKEADAFILRIPGRAGTVLGRELIKAGVPYAVEVVGDPWAAAAPGGVKCFLRPVIRFIGKVEMRHLCHFAALATYVTARNLQERYPPGGYSTFFSDAEITDEVLIDQSALERRIERTQARFRRKEPWRLCFVGGLHHLLKAPDVLVRAMSLCAQRGLDFELVIAGGGIYLPKIKDQAGRIGISERVKFLGAVPPGKEVYELLEDSDLFILPSLTEGLPRALVEAMAKGLPCIGSDTGGIPELLAPEDLVQPGDAESLASKVISVLSNQDRLGRMSRRNLETAKEYRKEELNRRRVEYYKRVRKMSEEHLHSNQC